MDKENVHNRVLFELNKKNEIFFLCRKTDGTGDHFEMWNKPDWERTNITCSFSYMESKL
jgi:hypothetical protein